MSTTQDRSMVPGKAHYSAEYIDGGRMFSFAHQIATVASFQPRSVLEIGVGPGLVSGTLRTVGFEVVTMDVEPELEPDVVGSVTDLPFEDESQDVALCSQVLEHLPWSECPVALSELHRVCRLGLVLSLPDITALYEIRVRAPIVGRIEKQFSRSLRTTEAWRRERWEQMGHYWEIGYEGSRLVDVRRTIENVGFRVDRIWRVSELPFHRFFRLEKRSEKAS